MVKKILSILAWVVTGAALVALFIAARQHYLGTPIQAINVDIERANDSGFVKQNAVLSDIGNLCEVAKIGSVNMEAIGKRLNANPWIESASSYVDLDGILNVNIKEYQPVLRVFGMNGTSAYLTAEGDLLPTSLGYTPHVLIASGNYALDKEHLNRQLCDTVEADQNLINTLQIFDAIERNEYLKSCIGQLYCNNKNEFEIVAKGIPSRIVLGDTDNLDDKLGRLEVFIRQKANGTEIKNFKKIDLKYKNQIVCTKR